MELEPSADHLGFSVAYNGLSYSGFQAQSNKRSVQDDIERALKIVLGFQGRIRFSSRTDSGVSAYDQWIYIPHGYSLWEDLSLQNRRRLRISLNAVLKGHAVFSRAMRLQSTFDFKKNVKSKEYHYYVAEGRSFVPTWKNECWFIRSSLDKDLIQREIKKICGTHDFAAFANRDRSKSEDKSTLRTIMKAEMKLLDHPFHNHSKLKFVFRADGFLYHMVRNIVGTLVDIGLHKRSGVESLLKLKDRTLAGVKAPAHPLILASTQIERRFYESLSEF